MKHWLLLGALAVLAVATGLFLPRGLLLFHGSENAVSPPDAEVADFKAIALPPKAAPQPTAAKEPATGAIPPAAIAGPGDMTYNPPAFPDVPSAQAVFVRLGLCTAMVLILCAALLWLGKRWIDPVNAHAYNSGPLRAVATLPLGGRCCIYLLQAGPCRVLAGVDRSGLRMLLPVNEPFDAALAGVDHESAGGPEKLAR